MTEPTHTTKNNLVIDVPRESIPWERPRSHIGAWLPLIAFGLVCLAVASYFVAWLLWVAGAVVVSAAAYLLFTLAWRAYVAIDGHREDKADRHLTRELALEQARLARLALETDRLEALARASTLEAGDGPTRRQSRILPDGRMITGALGHALPAAVPHNYAPRITNGSAPAPLALTAAGAQVTLEPQLPDIVHLIPALATARARGLLDPAALTLYLGESATGAVVAGTRDILMAAIVAGTGGGKSVFLRSLLAQWYTYYLAGAQVEFALIDHDRRELPLWASAANLLKWTNPETGKVETAFSDDSTRTESLIKWLYEEMENRARLDEDERERLPFVIIALEEIIDVFADIDATSKALLDKIMRRSRAVNFRVICTAQYMRVSDVGKAVKSQSRSKFAGSLGDDSDSARALGFDAKIVPSGHKGRFTFRLADATTGTVQTPYISPEQVKSLLATAPRRATERPGQWHESEEDTRPNFSIVRGASVGTNHVRGEVYTTATATGTGGTLTSWQENEPAAGPRRRETKEEAARRLWDEGFNSIRRLGDELTRLGYAGVASPDSARALINRLGLRSEGRATE